MPVKNNGKSTMAAINLPHFSHQLTATNNLIVIMWNLWWTQTTTWGFWTPQKAAIQHERTPFFFQTADSLLRCNSFEAISSNLRRCLDLLPSPRVRFTALCCLKSTLTYSHVDILDGWNQRRSTANWWPDMKIFNLPFSTHRTIGYDRNYFLSIDVLKHIHIWT